MNVRISLTTAAALACASGVMAGDVLWDNGPIVTHPGQGDGGADVSMASVEVNSGGANASNAETKDGNFRVADDFLVSGGAWNIDSISVNVYATNGDPNKPPFTDFNANIWDGPPGVDGSNIVATSTGFENLEWTGVYRVFNGAGNLGSTARAIMQVDLLFDDLSLEPGFYWVDWQADTETSAWANYVMDVNPNDPDDPITRGGNARQLIATGWVDLTVGDAEASPDFPFVVTGSSSCTGDLDGTGSVDGADLALLLGAWGPCPGCEADLDGSDTVDGADLALLLGAWGDCPAPGGVPTGGCCFEDGSCEELSGADCAAAAGSYAANFVTCEDADCPQPPSDCCDAEAGQVGCDDQDCADAVCAEISFCCSFEWDAECAALANEICDVCVCVAETEAEYQYDDGDSSGSITWTGGGVVGWAQRYDAVTLGTNEITNIATVYGSFGSTAGVEDGDPVGIAIFEDNGAGPGNVIYWDNTRTVDGDAVNSDVFQIFPIDPGVEVTGSFYIGVWVQTEDPEICGTCHPAPRDSQSINAACPDGISIYSNDVWLFGAAGEMDFFNYDPNNNVSGPINMHANGFTDVFLLRANQPE